jgi:hypothetical protein
MTFSFDLASVDLAANPVRIPVATCNDLCKVAPATQLTATELAALAQLSAALDAMAESHPGQRAQRLTEALGRFAADTDLASLLPGARHGRDATAIAATAATPVAAVVPAPAAAPGYQRHLLLADPQGRYSAVAIIWEKGQHSPVHGHHTWCAYSVVHGVLSESCFDWCDAAQTAQLGATARCLPRQVNYADAGLGSIHRLGNPHPATAISLHVYGVPGASIATAVNHVVAVHA